jgi:hypothetical protein
MLQEKRKEFLNSRGSLQLPVLRRANLPKEGNGIGKHDVQENKPDLIFGIPA